MSECWLFYAVRTARVIFTAKTNLDVFSLSGEQVWTFSVLGDRIYEMRCPFVAVGVGSKGLGQYKSLGEYMYCGPRTASSGFLMLISSYFRSPSYQVNSSSRGPTELLVAPSGGVIYLSVPR